MILETVSTIEQMVHILDLDWFNIMFYVSADIMIVLRQPGQMFQQARICGNKTNEGECVRN